MTRVASPTRPGVVIGVLATAGIIAAVMHTLVIPLLSQLPILLHTTPSNAIWAVTITLLVGAVTTPVAGRLGDMYGKRRILLISFVPLIAGSVVCALATSIGPMIIGRGLQGMAVGLVPLGISALRDLLPPERLGSAIALISSSLGIGAALGLPLSAAVIEYSNWRGLFWGSAALAAAIGALILILVPDAPTSGSGGRFDVLGAVGLGAALVCLLLAVSKGASWGWTRPSILGLFAAVIVVLPIWGWWELRTTCPLVNLRVTARPQILLTNTASVVVGMAMYGQALITPQLLQLPTATGYGLGQSMLAMGLLMAPGGLMMMVVSPIGAKLSAARGPKITLILGCLIIAVGYGSAQLLMGTVWGLLIVTVIASSGTALAYGAMPALIMASVPLSETASANGVNTLMRSIGTALSAAVIGAMLALMTTNFGGHAITTESGFRAGLFLGLGVAVLSAAIAATIPASRAATAPLPIHQ